MCNIRMLFISALGLKLFSSHLYVKRNSIISLHPCLSQNSTTTTMYHLYDPGAVRTMCCSHGTVSVYTVQRAQNEGRKNVQYFNLLQLLIQFLNKTILFYTYECVFFFSTCMSVYHARLRQKTKGGIKVSETRVIDVCEPPCGCWKQPANSARASGALRSWAISVAGSYFSLNLIIEPDN